jgi:hypothetical protein
LKDDLQPAPANRLSDQLKTVMIGFVSPYFKVGKETFDGFLEGDSMSGQFVAVKVIFKIGGGEALPVGHNVYPELIITQPESAFP